jgi:hypothetical protein
MKPKFKIFFFFFKFYHIWKFYQKCGQFYNSIFQVKSEFSDLDKKTQFGQFLPKSW